MFLFIWAVKFGGLHICVFEIAEALLIAAWRAHVQGQGDIGAPPGRTGKGGSEYQGQGRPLAGGLGAGG